MTFRRTSAFPLHIALLTILGTLAPSAFTQQPPPPPPGVVIHMPDQPDPSVKIPRFDIISVKPSKDNQTRLQFTVDGMHGQSVAIQFLLFEGFGGLNQDQVIGAPAWASTDGFDIDAKVAAEDIPTLAKLTFDQRRTMFQQILTDRFKLVLHHEKRELPIYNLTVAKGGSKLKPSAPADPASGTQRRNFMMFGPGKVTATGAAIPRFITPLSRLLGRVIVDKTGLTGTYDFTLEWTPEDSAAPPTPDASGQTAPSIFTAIQEQLGLKLEATKAPVDVLVIDHIEKPSEN